MQKPHSSKARTRANRRSVIVSAGLVAGAFVMTQCATLTEGTTQTILVSSEPGGANCEISREGLMVGTVAATPSIVTVDKDSAPLAFRCKKTGYVDTREAVDAKFIGTTAGNLLLGGIIGIAIDAGSGANNEYPAQVLVKLIPASFGTESERSAYFTSRMDDLRRNSASKIAKIHNECAEDMAEICANNIAKVEQDRESRLMQIEAARTLTKIAP